MIRMLPGVLVGPLSRIPSLLLTICVLNQPCLASNPVQTPCSQLFFLKNYSAALDLFISKQFNKSLQLLTPLLACRVSSQYSSSLHLNIGRNYQELGQKDLALKAFTSAINLYPSSYQAYTNRGLVLASLGRLDDANRDFSQALRIDPSNFIALSNRGVAYATQGKLSIAINDFDKSIMLNPSYGEAYINRGIVRELTGDIRGACSDWKRAIQLRQFSARSWVAQQCD
jgi:tetratricopeptide (TPR) repeat protein